MTDASELPDLRSDETKYWHAREEKLIAQTRADAETIRSLRTINEGQQREGHAAIARLEQKLAAQSAELGRLKQRLKDHGL